VFSRCSLSLEFGDWNGPNGTLIKRRYSGPLPGDQEELKRRTDSVAFRPIWSTRRRSLTARRGHVWRIWLRHRGVVTRKERWFNGRSRRSTKWCTAKPVNRTSILPPSQRGTETSMLRDILCYWWWKFEDSNDQVSSSELTNAIEACPCEGTNGPSDWRSYGNVIRVLLLVREIWSRDRNRSGPGVPLFSDSGHTNRS
jgi:hypothetical protein